MQKLLVLLFLVNITCGGCKKCVICTDTIMVTRTKPAQGYPHEFQSLEEFCGKERYATEPEKEYEIVAPGDSIIYYTERSCVEKK